jgi:hypothetical protein
VATSNSGATADACVGEAVAGDAVAETAAGAGAGAGAAGALVLCATQLIEREIAKKGRKIRNDFTGTLARADDELDLQRL